MNSPIVGIDLGTTNSVVSILDDKKPKTLLIDNDKLLPSVVSITSDGVLVGKVARNLAILEPENTIASIKRKMGEDVSITIGEKQMRPEEISSLILQKIRQTVIEHYQLTSDAVVRAVITVPAYFTEEQRAATKQAGELANLQVERIINEPTAAALAYGMANLDEAIFAVYDLGGGTFDISIIESDAGLVEVRSSTGDNHLGGDDFDDLLGQKIWKDFLSANELASDLQASNKEIARLKRIAEQTKINLSSETEVSIQESFFFQKEDINYHLEQVVSRSDFEALIEEHISKTVELLNKAVMDADLTRSDLDGIILVGGSSRIPLVSQLIEEKLKIKPVLITLPDEAVSHGATVQGAIIDKKDIDTILIDITPHSLGTGSIDDQSYMSPKLLDWLKRKEAGEVPEDEEAPMNLGATVIIPKNSPVPVRRSMMFYSVVDFQTEYEVQVYQGEGARLEDNKIIGDSLLEVADPPETGEVKVTFELDINGLLNVTALEINTNEKLEVTFQSSMGQKAATGAVEGIAVLSDQTTENTLLKRADALLAMDIDVADKEDLVELLNNYEAAKDVPERLSELEEELLNLLYYLEKE